MRVGGDVLPGLGVDEDTTITTLLTPALGGPEIQRSQEWDGLTDRQPKT